MTTNPHTYTPQPPHLTGTMLTYLGGESMPGGEVIYPTAGCTIEVSRRRPEPRATVSVQLWNDSSNTAVNLNLDADNLRRLAHRLLDAAADLDAASDIKATTGQEAAA